MRKSVRTEKWETKKGKREKKPVQGIKEKLWSHANLH